MKRNRKNERGVTFMVAAFTLLAILAMAAISVDVAQMYVARGEAQKAADAAALAGAKMFVASSYTSEPTLYDTNPICLSGGAGLSAPVNAQAEIAAKQNTIAGIPATVTSIQCSPVASANNQNPAVAVSVTRTGIPTFFGRVLGASSTTTNATAIAEAYNPSGSDTPIQVAIKPWLVPNCDPTGASGSCIDHYFIDATGNIANPSILGQTIQLNLITSGHAVATGTNGDTLDFYPLNIPTTPSPLCPSCAGGNAYRENIACTSQVLVSCGQQISSSQSIKVQTGFGLTTSTKTAARCLIHTNSDGPTVLQDSLIAPGPPAIFHGGEGNPNPALQGVDNISRSDSVVNVPLYQDPTHPPLCNSPGSCGGSATIIGFLQIAITQTSNAGGSQVQGVILNAAGCTPMSISNYAPNTGVTGSGTSPIPVRLIHNP